MSLRRPVSTPHAPAAIGPYSQAVASTGLLFCSGQIALDPETSELVPGGPAEQAGRCLANLEAVCTAAGARLSDAVRVTVYLTDLSAFAPVNDAYAGFFDDAPPARVTVGVDGLPRGAQVQIDAIVALGSEG